MEKQAWERKEYESWDEAFRGLSPIVRRQSVRVAAYTRALFVSACRLHYREGSGVSDERMKGTYADLAYKCGMYHQIGKALVPHEYQIMQADFTREERTVYEKYTADGRFLASMLQDKGARAKEKRKGKHIEAPTKNIPWLMIREACGQHMERFDGSGYPEGIMGDGISPIGEIVGLAKELDRIASETKSENPFEVAVAAIREQAGVGFRKELVDVFEAAMEECREIYNKYIVYTRTLPKTVSLVEKRSDRKMGLQYRPLVCDKIGTVVMYEAIPWFGGILGEPDETEGIEEVRDLLRRTELVEDISWYFLYEAADTVVRMNNCKLEVNAIILNMLPEFYTLKTQLQRFNQLFEDQPINKNQLWLTISAETFNGLNKSNLEILRRYTRNGIKLVLDCYKPEDVPLEVLKEMQIDIVRIDPSAYLNYATAEHMALLREEGFKVLGKDANETDALPWLVACGMYGFSGTLTGELVDENGLILDSLARELK